MGVNEKKIENYLKKEVENIGGISYKWVSPGRNGVPDRIVIFKGNVVFVEVKSPGGDLQPDQRFQLNRLQLNGAKLSVVSTRKEVNELVKKIKTLCF